jgi:glucose/arabinose dehydrogenase
VKRAGLALLVCAALAAPASAALPRGFKLQNVANGIAHPTNIAFHPGGGMFVSSSQYPTDPADGVWFVPTRNARPRHVITGLYTALGIAWHKGSLYVSYVVPYSTNASSHTGEVAAYSGWTGSRFTKRRVVVRGIPVGLHRVDSLAVGPDDRMYLGVGSREDTRAGGGVSSTIVSFKPSGGGLRVEARGLRNPYGLAFIPGTSSLLVSDNGRDDLGLDSPPEELNVFDVRARPLHFGFPACWGQGGTGCRGKRGALVKLAPHSAVGGVAVARRFGPWGLTAFVTEYGSSFTGNPSGGTLVRVSLSRRGGAWRGRATTLHRFGLHEPLGLALSPRNELYITLWESGRVVRIVPPKR